MSLDTGGLQQLGQGRQTSGAESLSYFFGNLARLISETRVTPRQLSNAIGREPDYVATLMRRRLSPDLEVVYALAGALKVDVADLLRPGPSFGFSAENSRDYWAEKVAEKVLAGALEESLQNRDVEAPTIDAVLSWWHLNDGLLTGMERLDQYVELFARPDAALMRPVPYRIGPQSLAARELGISTVQQLEQVFESSEPSVSRLVALAHADVAEGQPKLSLHSILIDLSSSQLVKLTYARLLLPVRDAEGRRFVLNYSKPIRRNEIGGEDVGELEPVHRRQPVFAGLD